MSRNEDFLQGYFKSDEGDQTNYFYGAGENSLGTTSGANVVVKHPIHKVHYYDRDHYGDPADEYDIRRWQEREADKDGNVPMFKEEHHPPVLDFAMATKDAGFHAGRLGLHAVADIERRFGERPVASSSTSRYSTKIANDAIKSGIIKGVEGQEPGEAARVGNTLSYQDAHENIQSTHRKFKNRAEGGARLTAEPIDSNVISEDARALTLEGLNNKRANKNGGKNRFSELNQGIKDASTAVGSLGKSTQMELPF